MSDETQDSPTPEGEETQAPKACWEQRTEFKINGQMREVIKATITAYQSQIDVYRRKIEKLQYGS